MPYAQNNDVKIYYEVHGQGEPLVLLHGFTSNIQQWKLCGYVEALQKSYQLVLIDSRGHGRSDKPHDPRSYMLESRIADIKSVLSGLQIQRAHFFGYSMGGWLAFGLAVHYPELVRSLIIGGAHPYEDALASFQDIDGSDPNAFIAALEDFIGEKIAEEVKPMRLQNDLVALVAAARPRQSYQPYLESMNMPVMLFVGDRDSRHALVQRAAKELAVEQVVILPGASHATALFASAALLPHVIAFLQRHNGISGFASG